MVLTFWNSGKNIANNRPPLPHECWLRRAVTRARVTRASLNNPVVELRAVPPDDKLTLSLSLDINNCLKLYVANLKYFT